MKYIITMALAISFSCGLTVNCKAQTADTTITVKVKGITCSSDHNLIKANVEKLDGVSTFEVTKQGTTSAYKIIYDPKKTTKQKIIVAIEGTGSCENSEERPYKVKK